MVATAVEPETSTDGSRGDNGRFLSGNKCGRGTPLAGRVEKMRAFMVQTCEKRIGEVVEVLFDLAINERQAWAIKEVLDRALGKIEPPDAAKVPKSMTQVNISLPDPPGGRHEVPGLLDEEP